MDQVVLKLSEFPVNFIVDVLNLKFREFHGKDISHHYPAVLKKALAPYHIKLPCIVEVRFKILAPLGEVLRLPEHQLSVVDLHSPLGRIGEPYNGDQ